METEKLLEVLGWARALRRADRTPKHALHCDRSLMRFPTGVSARYGASAMCRRSVRNLFTGTLVLGAAEELSFLGRVESSVVRGTSNTAGVMPQI